MFSNFRNGRKIFRMWQYAGFLCLALTLAHPAHSATRSDLDLAKEYQVKALFLYNFANFVE